MQNKPCPIEPLVSSKYCQLSVCPECNVVNLNLPGRISLQFETAKFLEIAHAFNQSAQMLRDMAAPKQKGEKIVKLTHLH